MQVLDAEQIKQWDAFTITHEPIESIDLMERAALSCYQWLIINGYKEQGFHIYSGKGNNGGDGLALARLLTQHQIQATVFILEFGTLGSADFQQNLTRLHDTHCSIHFISTEASIHAIPENTIVIDALFGSGLNKPLEGLSARIADHIINSGAEVISIDLPSGMFCNRSSIGHTIVQARHTLSFQCYKLAFLLPENEKYLGQIHILDIGLLPEFLPSIAPRFLLLEEPTLKVTFKKRKPFSHKGNFGHAGLIAGSYGMMGAVVLAATACLRSGAGKLTCHVPAAGYNIMQSSLPEAMCVVDENDFQITGIKDTSPFTAVAIGPGIGRRPSNELLLRELFLRFGRPVVLDADALNTLADFPALQHQIPHGSVLTPHVKEFDRMFGECSNDFERLHKAIEKANALGVVIVLKGHYSFVATPNGPHYFNTTGNAGLAKGGSGDLLTGMVLAFLAQGYEPVQAACLGVYLHGLAADLAVSHFGMESLLASDTASYIGQAIKHLY